VVVGPNSIDTGTCPLSGLSFDVLFKLINIDAHVFIVLYEEGVNRIDLSGGVCIVLANLSWG